MDKKKAKKAISVEALVAALGSGATLNEAGDPVIPEPAQEPELKAPDLAPDPEPKAPELKAPVADPELQAKLQKLEADLAAANSELSSAKTKITSLESKLIGHDGLTEIARKSIKRMAIGMGARLLGVDALEGDVLVKQFEAVEVEFHNHFKAGQQSNPAADATPASTETVPALAKRRIDPQSLSLPKKGTK